MFSNESVADRNEELWQPADIDLAYPDRLRRLDSLLDALFIEELLPAPAPEEGADPLSSAAVAPLEPAQSALESTTSSRLDNIRATGPFPAEDTGGEEPQAPYHFIDFARDPWLQLPPEASQFSQTNQALERSPSYRLLFHGLWRQPVGDEADSQPIYVYGGNRYGDQFELQGSIAIYFNPRRDRVVADADLWLSEFRLNPAPAARPLAAIGNNGEDYIRDSENTEAVWHLPTPPEEVRPPWLPPVQQDNYEPVRIYQLLQAREMRSSEFHYLDHPALGVLVTVEPYEVPPLPEEPVSDEPTSAGN